MNPIIHFYRSSFCRPLSLPSPIPHPHPQFFFLTFLTFSKKAPSSSSSYHSSGRAFRFRTKTKSLFFPLLSTTTTRKTTCPPRSHPSSPPTITQTSRLITCRKGFFFSLSAHPHSTPPPHTHSTPQQPPLFPTSFPQTSTLSLTGFFPAWLEEMTKLFHPP